MYICGLKSNKIMMPKDKKRQVERGKAKYYDF